MASNNNIRVLILVVLGSIQGLSTSNNTEGAETIHVPRDAVMGIIACLEEEGMNICTDHVPTLNVFLCAEPNEYAGSVDELLDLRDFFDDFVSIRDSTPPAQEDLSRLTEECILAARIHQHRNMCTSVEIASAALHQHEVVDLFNASTSNSTARRRKNQDKGNWTETNAVDSNSKKDHPGSLQKSQASRRNQSSSEKEHLTTQELTPETADKKST
ncbi:hypothetical protein RF11_02919 [Thelohanellus kitauei]|uniref:Uncharacterized protein n=1 Tax=Thelohanellus kitauei TaxID=669202 RepID=A0A0C2N4X3_THEKT|nr:hypothetical protein RF11_02919 [Thelohanellus kitauei]